MSAVVFIVATLVVVSAMLSVLFFLAWKTLDRGAHALTWSACFAAATLQWIANLARDVFPSPEFAWLVMTALALTAVGLAVLGHQQRVGRANHFAAIWPALIAIFGVVAHFTLISPHEGIRTGFHPMVTGMMFVYVSRIIVTPRSTAMPAEIGAAIITGFFGLNQVFAGAIAIGWGAQATSDGMLLYQQINFIFMPACYVGMSAFMVLVMAADMAEEMRQLAVRDQLTDTLNRRGLFDAAERAFASARRSGQPLALIMTDIDHFKRVNDTHGHAVGDAALRRFAQMLGRDRRADDLVGRFGGEEFVLLLPGATAREAARLSEQLRASLRADNAQSEDGLDLTASYGVSAARPEDESVRDILRRADHGLYLAKGAGRDRVETVEYLEDPVAAPATTAA